MFGLSAYSQAPFSTAIAIGGSVFNLSMVENVGVADTEATITDYLVSLTAAMTVEDLNSDANIFIGTIVEDFSAGMQGDIQANVSASITEGSDLASQEEISRLFVEVVTEAQTMEESLVPYFAALETRQEDFTAEDINSVVADMLFTISENIEQLDINAIAAQFNINIAENMAMTDSIAAINSYLASQTESITVDDIRAITLNVVFVITESLSAEDANSVVKGFVISMQENINVMDAQATASQYLQTINETFTMLDVMFPRGWIKIDDSQTANWVDVNDNQ